MDTEAVAVGVQSSLFKVILVELNKEWKYLFLKEKDSIGTSIIASGGPLEYWSIH